MTGIFPLTRSTSNDCERRWLAACTRPRHEIQVAQQLEYKGLRYLLPRYRRLRRWSDRVKRVEAPLFPGYIFVQVSDAERVPVLRTLGVTSIVSSGGRPAYLGNSEIEVLRACTAYPEAVEPHPYLQVGRRVRVMRGAFAGLEGILVQKKNAARLVVAVDPIMRSIAIDLHSADVEQIA